MESKRLLEQLLEQWKRHAGETDHTMHLQNEYYASRATNDCTMTIDGDDLFMLLTIALHAETDFSDKGETK